MATSIWAIVVIIGACIIGSLGAMFLKKATLKISFFNIKSIIFNKELMIGVLFYAVGTVVFIPALKYGELSVLYPFVATTYIWVSLFSIKFLNEKMNRFKWLGIICILIGVSFIGIGS
jgi:uncharacterized membrane protein